MVSISYVFQDASGSPIANGLATFRLSTDAVVTGSHQQVSAEILNKFTLDSSGALSGSIWPNDQLTPTNTTYKAAVYTVKGQKVWQGELVVLTGSFVLLETGDFVLLESGDFVLLE